MGEEIEGAMQHAPQPMRQSIAYPILARIKRSKTAQARWRNSLSDIDIILGSVAESLNH
jgi:hypothetical protein